MKTMTYILNLTLLVVCTQFAFAADNADTGGKQMYISFEDAQAALPDKEYAQDQVMGILMVVEVLPTGKIALPVLNLPLPYLVPLY